MDYIRFLILFTQVYGKPFPSWEEGANDVLCAKFIYFYEPKCFRNHTNIIMQEILNLQGVKRLQETCYHLALALGDCLKFFNDRCSQDLLQTGEASFTSTVLAPATRAALFNFRELWTVQGASNFGLDINRCTVYGGLCEHPEQLRYCGGQSSIHSTGTFWIFMLIIIAHLYYLSYTI